jgi:AcrR family transcriptional regulator
MTAAKARISKDPEERREEILAAAYRLFQTQGYEKTSVQAITDEVGVAKGLFYHYFDSKVDLLNQLAVWQAGLYMDALPTVAEMEGGVVQKLRDFVGRTVQWKFEDLRAVTIAYLDVLYRDENAALRHALMSEFSDRLVPFFAEIIAEGNREGVCDAPDTTVMAEQVVALSTGQGDRWARLLRAAIADPTEVEPLLQRLRGYETAVERVLGMRPDTLCLYDYDYLRTMFAGLADE